MLGVMIISGGSEEERDIEVEKITLEYIPGISPATHPDIFILETVSSIGIEQVRELEKQLSLKPYQAKVKVAIIKRAEKLTLPAQNALLKTLEEPPANTIIILDVPNTGLLLPTVVSRCQVKKLKTFRNNDEDSSAQEKLLETILKSGAGERLKIATDYSKTPLEATAFLKDQLTVCRKRLHQKVNINEIRRLHNILQSLDLLEKNINPQLVVGNLLLHY